MDWLYSVLRYLVLGRSGFVFEIAICEILFSIPVKFRKWPWLTVPLALAAHFSFGLFVPYFNRVTLVIFALSVLLQWAIMQKSFHMVLFNSMAAYAVQNLGVNCVSIMRILTGLSGWGMLVVEYLTTIAVYAACYFIFARRGQREPLTMPHIVQYIICFFTVFITNIMYWYMTLAAGALIEVALTLSVCNIMSLMLQYSQSVMWNFNMEARDLEQLLLKEQKQHELSQETIDIINIKCHDLKKQIAMLRNMLGDKAEPLVSEVENAVIIYDSSVNTGNKSLDLIINEEKLYCERYGITLDVVADGQLIDFMTPTDIYALFGNAIQNAIESVVNEDEAHRTIWFELHKSGNYISILIKNYCSHPVSFRNGRPVTSKGDLNFHGYGIRSMQYIVDKYHGNMVINCSDSTFIVKIIMPVK